MTIKSALCLASIFLAILQPAPADAGDLVITEVMASNSGGVTDIDGDSSDWIEICNLGGSPCNLNGYFLTDDVNDLEKWEFPAVTLDAGQYLLVFASEKNRRNPNAELHSNFRLDKDGELLVLIRPDGQTPISGFAPTFPPQVTDASYGISTDSTIHRLVESDASLRVRIPSDDSLGNTWRNRTFNDSGWTSGTQGVGYERSSGYDPLIGADVEGTMYDENSGAFIRIPFSVDDASDIDGLTLKMKYDDGFVAFLNGTRIAGANAPSGTTIPWNQRATASHSDNDAIVFQEFDASGFTDRLVSGDNVLAIHGLNFSNTSSDFLIIAELEGVTVGSIDRESFEYFDDPTPGRPNGPGFEDISADVNFSHESGAYPSSISLTLSAAGGGQIRYTTNGTKPTESSTLYSGAISVSSVSLVNARSFQSGKLPGRTLNKGYMILAASARNFSSNLPIVLIDTFNSNVGQNSFTRSLFEFIDTDETGRARITDTPDFTGHGGIKIRGSSSVGFPKKQYAVEIWDEVNLDRDVSILGFPTQSDWILYAPYSDKALMRNFLSYDWSNEIGRYATRSQFVEVYYKTNAGTLSSSHYAGVYVFMEKIKRDPKRVDIAKIDQTDNTAPAITGGYILKKDRLDPGDSGITTSRGHRLGLVEPKEDEISAQQRNYILGYINQFEAALYGANFRDPVNGYRRYIDTASFIDHHIMVEVTKNIDGYRLSTFMFKDREGLLNMGPIWDYNLSLGNANYLNGWIPQGWYWEQIGDDGYPWYRRLFQDPDFQQEYIDRWSELRRNEFQTQKLLDQIDDVAAFLQESQTRNFNEWRILGNYVWPNWYVADTYAEEINWMKGWVDGRLDWFDSNYVATPSFNQQGGAIDPPFGLAINSTMGTIYYTTDGSDPRLPGGAINPTAIEHGSSDSLELVSPDVTDEVRVLVPTNSSVDSTWRNVTFNDAAWTRGTTGIGVGYERSAGYENLIDVDVESAMYNLRTSVYVRLRFDLDDPDIYDFLVLNMKYDDGFVAYLNGNRVAASNAPASPAWDSDATGQHDDAAAVNYVPFSLAGAEDYLRSGTNVLAIHGLNANTTSSDLLLVPQLVASSVEDGSTIPLTGATQIRARARSGSRWSGLNDVTFVPNSELQLRVTEIMYHPANLPEGSPYDEEQLEFIEFQNVSADPLPLTGVLFDEGLQFDFNTGVVALVPPGEYVLVVRNIDAFRWFYDTTDMLIAGEFNGRLENAGESLRILDGRGEIVQLFAYDDLWYPTTDGGGYSLHIVDSSLAKETWNQASSWTASAEAEGSPGSADDSDLPDSGWQRIGDANQDGLIDVSDAVKILRGLFLGDPGDPPCDGESITDGGNLLALDTNGDDSLDVSDVLYLLAYLFEGGPDPAGGTSCVRVAGCPNVCRP
jgi:hypothetical protein